MVQFFHAKDGVHKYVAVFDDKQVAFGAIGYEDDFTITGDKKQKRNYLARHKKREDWNDPKTAGALSRYILWGPTTSIKENIKRFVKKFHMDLE
jgi:hypothetical protein